jgi:hypothetical protein
MERWASFDENILVVGEILLSATEHSRFEKEGTLLQPYPRFQVPMRKGFFMHIPKSLKKLASNLADLSVRHQVPEVKNILV